MSKVGIATSDYDLMVSLTGKKFNEVPNVFTCDVQNIF